MLLLSVSFHDSVLICYYSRSPLLAVVVWFFSLIFPVPFQGETDYEFSWIYRTCNTQTSRNLTRCDLVTQHQSQEKLVRALHFFLHVLWCCFFEFFSLILSVNFKVDHEILKSIIKIQDSVTAPQDPFQAASSWFSFPTQAFSTQAASLTTRLMTSLTTSLMNGNDYKYTLQDAVLSVIPNAPSSPFVKQIRF